MGSEDGEAMHETPDGDDMSQEEWDEWLDKLNNGELSDDA